MSALSPPVAAPAPAPASPAPAPAAASPPPPVAAAVQVALRIRPLNNRELSSGSQVVCRASGPCGVVLHPPTGRVSRKSTTTGSSRAESAHQDKQTFAFDFVYGDGEPVDIGGERFERNSQERVFREIGTTILENAFAGFNCSLLAYGQTGSGKCFAGEVGLMRADGSLVRADQVKEGDELMGDDGTPRVVRHGTLVRGKAPLVRIVSHDEAHTDALVVNLEHILVLRVSASRTVTPVVEHAHEQGASFQFRTWGLNEHNTLRCTAHSFPTLHDAHRAHIEALALARPLLWETPVRRFLNLHLLAKDADPEAFHPGHSMFVTQEARDVCRIYAPSRIDNESMHGALQRALAHACGDETSRAMSRARSMQWARLVGLWIGAQWSADHAATPACSWELCLSELDASHDQLQRVLRSLGLLPSPLLLQSSWEEDDASKPIQLLLDSVDVRSHLLAGLLEGGVGSRDNLAFAVHAASSHHHIAGMVWLARSLGVRVGAVQSCPDGSASVRLSGSALISLPFLSPKLAALAPSPIPPSDDDATEDEEHASPFHLEPWADGSALPYYGFGVSGPNERFLTRDFLVTHNSHSMMGYGSSHTPAVAAVAAAAGSDAEGALASLPPPVDHTGLIPRLCNAMFARAAAMSAADPDTSFKVEVSYLEIYAEKIQDLLDKGKKNLQVRQHPLRGPYVEGLTVAPVRDYKQLEQFMDAGNASRTVASTLMNATSSRSHAVFTIVLTVTHHDREVKMSSSTDSKIQLVDLAGSERAEFTGATGVRLKEAAMINQSLSTLGRVISALALKSQMESATSPNKRGKADDTFVPFRDSVLTWLLRESLGGNSKTIMIACVSPADMNYEESLSTLRYASNAKNIKQHAVKNEDANSALIRTLRAEIDALKAQLAGQHRPMELQDDAHQMVEKLRAQLLENAESMKEMERLWAAKLEETNRVAQQRLEEIQAQGASLAQAQAQLQQEQAAAANAAAAAEEAAATAAAAPADPASSSSVDDLSASPFLVNLTERPQPGESLLLYLHKGSTVVMRAKAQADPAAADGSTAAAAAAAASHQFELHGAAIRDRHARFELDDAGTVTLHFLPPQSGPSNEDPDGTTQGAGGAEPDLFVNGAPLSGSRVLVHGDRVALGDKTFFRFSRSRGELEQAKGENPAAAAATGTKRGFRGINIHGFPGRAVEAAAAPVVAAEPEPQPEPAQPMPADEDDEDETPIQEPLPERLAPEPEPEPVPEPVAEPDPVAEAKPATVAATSPPSSSASNTVSKPRSSWSPLDAARRWIGWVRNEAVSAPALDALVLREVKLQPRHRQKRTSAAATLSAAAGNVSGSSSSDPSRSLTFVLHVLYRWRLRMLRRRVQDEAMAVLFLVDEANAMASAMALPERYRVELHSRFVPPALAAATHSDGSVTLAQVGSGGAGGAGGDAVPSETLLSMTPLQRLRSLRCVSIDVVAWRRRGAAAGLIAPTDIWSMSDFGSQLLSLRERYHDTIEGGGGYSAENSHSLGADHRLLHGGSGARAQLVGTATVYLEALRYGQPLRHTAQVLSLRGDVAGWLIVELELEHLGAEEAQRILAEEADQTSDEDESQSEGEDNDEAAPPSRKSSTSATGAEDGPSKPSSVPGTGLLCLSVRVAQYDTARGKGALGLAAQGCRNVQVKYVVHDDPYVFRTRRVRVHGANDSLISSSSSPPRGNGAAATATERSLKFSYAKRHYFAGAQLSPSFLDFLAHDALTFDVVGRFDESDGAWQENLAAAASALSPTAAAAAGSTPASHPHPQDIGMMTPASLASQGQGTAAKMFAAFMVHEDNQHGDSDDERSVLASAIGSRAGSRRGSRVGSRIRRGSFAEPPSPGGGSSLAGRLSSPPGPGSSPSASTSSSLAASPPGHNGGGGGSGMRPSSGMMPKFSRNAPVKIDTAKGRLSFGGGSSGGSGSNSVASPGASQPRSSRLHQQSIAEDESEAFVSATGGRGGAVTSFHPSVTTPFAVPAHALPGVGSAGAGGWELDSSSSHTLVQGRKSADHLLYVCVDVEEEVVPGSGSFVSAPMKGKSEGPEVVFKLTALRQKKLVVSLLQVDHDPTFCIESLAGVQLRKVQRVRPVTGGAASASSSSSSSSGALKSDHSGRGSFSGGATSLAFIPVESAPSTPARGSLRPQHPGVGGVGGAGGGAPATRPLKILEQFAHVEHRLLVATVEFSPYLSDHDMFREETRDGERVQLCLGLQLYFARSTQSVWIDVEVQSKTYKKAPSASGGAGGLFRRAAASAAEEAERLPRLGHHYCVSRQATSYSIRHLFTEHEFLVDKLQRRLRLDQLGQHQAFMRRVRGEANARRADPHAPPLPSYLAQIDAPTLDSLVRIPKARMQTVAMVAANNTALKSGSASVTTGSAGSSAAASGIQVLVERVPRETGLKCGFLSKQSGTSKAAHGGPAAPQTSDTYSTPVRGSSGAGGGSSGGGGKWHVKWCVLRPPYLMYFQKKGDVREKGIIHLFQARFELNPALPNTFFIHTHTRSYHLQAASEKDMNNWLKAMAPVSALEGMGALKGPSLSPLAQQAPPANSPRRNIITPHKRNPSLALQQMDQ